MRMDLSSSRAPRSVAGMRRCAASPELAGGAGQSEGQHRADRGVDRGAHDGVHPGAEPWPARRAPVPRACRGRPSIRTTGQLVLVREVEAYAAEVGAVAQVRGGGSLARRGNRGGPPPRRPGPRRVREGWGARGCRTGRAVPRRPRWTGWCRGRRGRGRGCGRSARRRPARRCRRTPPPCRARRTRAASGRSARPRPVRGPLAPGRVGGNAACLTGGVGVVLPLSGCPPADGPGSDPHPAPRTPRGPGPAVSQALDRGTSNGLDVAGPAGRARPGRTVRAAAERASARPPISTWTTATGFAGAAAAAARRASARTWPSPDSSAPLSPRTQGMAVTTTASQSSSARAAASAARKSAGVAPVVRSSGRSGRSPSVRQASYVSRPRDSELPRIATRGPAGSGWPARSRPASTSSVTVPTRMTPAWRSSAETVASGTFVTGTAWPGGVVPLCRAPLTTTGFAAAVRRASRVNLRGLPMD
ncbi:hypothetical protein STENM36S_00938 [Streptomyces tendae]